MQFFAENPYFSEKVLKKVYTYQPPEGFDSEKSDENGIKDSALDFDWDRDIVPEVCFSFNLHFRCGVSCIELERHRLLKFHGRMIRRT